LDFGRAPGFEPGAKHTSSAAPTEMTLSRVDIEKTGSMKGPTFGTSPAHFSGLHFDDLLRRARTIVERSFSRRALKR